MRVRLLAGGFLTLALISCFNAGGGRAADLAVAPKASVLPVDSPAIKPWTVALTPYGWAVSLSGATTVRGRTVDVNAGFFDILENTQFPKGLLEVAALGEFRYGQFALLTDIAPLSVPLSV